MKTVPYSYPQKKEIAGFKEKKIESEPGISKEMNGYKPEFADLFHQNSSFRFMKVHTDVLEEMGIKINDLVVVDPAGIPTTGKIVVVKVDDTLMIRRYEKMRNGFVLNAENQKIAPLKIEPGYNHVSLIGVVVYVIKSL